MSDDANLLRRYAEDRSEADFTAWVQRHFDLVYAAALRHLQGDHHRAREAAQIVFVDAARKAGRLCRHPAVVGWLYTSTHFAAQKLIRSESRRQIREGTAHAMQNTASAAAGSWEDIRPYLDAEMLALGSVDRSALLLRFFDQRTLSEVGSQLGLTENAARMRVDRALTKLRQRLARRGLTSSSAALAAGLAGNAVTAAPAGLSAAVAGGALAEVATLSAGGTALIAPLMASKITMGIAAGFGLLALSSGFYFRAQARNSAQSSLALARASAQLEAGLRALPEERKRETDAAAALRSGLNRPSQAKSGAKSPGEALNREFAENPQLRQAYAKSYLAAFKLKYGPLAQNMGWSNSQMDQVGRLELKALSDRFDLEQAASLIGKDGADSTLASMEDQVRNANRAAEIGIIGEVGVEALQDYDRGYAAREIAGQVAAGSFYSAAPLSPSQADTLKRLLTQGSVVFQQGGRLEPDTIDWDGVLTQATAVLPAPQVEALRALRARWEQKNLADAADLAGEGAP